MTRTVVFLQAPSVLEEPPGARHHWTVHPKRTRRSTASLYPTATLAAAGRRISALYENVIFHERAPFEDMSYNDDVDGGRGGGELQ